MDQGNEPRYVIHSNTGIEKALHWRAFFLKYVQGLLLASRQPRVQQQRQKHAGSENSHRSFAAMRGCGCPCLAVVEPIEGVHRNYPRNERDCNLNVPPELRFGFPGHTQMLARPIEIVFSAYRGMRHPEHAVS